MSPKNDYYNPSSRVRESRGFMDTVNGVYNRYKSIWLFAGILGVGLGFGFQTPAETFKKIEIRLDSLEREVKHLKETDHKLLDLACTGNNISAHDKAILELPCVSYDKDTAR